MSDETTTDTLTLTAEIVASYLGANSHVKADDIPAIIRSDGVDGPCVRRWCA